MSKTKWGRRYSDNQAYPKDVDSLSLPSMDYPADAGKEIRLQFFGISHETNIGIITSIVDELAMRVTDEELVNLKHATYVLAMNNRTARELLDLPKPLSVGSLKHLHETDDSIEYIMQLALEYSVITPAYYERYVDEMILKPDGALARYRAFGEAFIDRLPAHEKQFSGRMRVRGIPPEEEYEYWKKHRAREAKEREHLLAKKAKTAALPVTPDEPEKRSEKVVVAHVG